MPEVIAAAIVDGHEAVLFAVESKYPLTAINWDDALHKAAHADNSAFFAAIVHKRSTPQTLDSCLVIAAKHDCVGIITQILAVAPTINRDYALRSAQNMRQTNTVALLSA